MRAQERAGPAPLPRRPSQRELIGHALATSIGLLFESEKHVRDDGDAEWIHAARVATRTLRSQLRTFGAALDPVWSTWLRAELRALADRLGAVRDGDVLIADLMRLEVRLEPEDRPAVAEVLAPFRVLRAASYRTLAGELRGDRYASLIGELARVAREGPRLIARSCTSPCELPATIMRKPWKRLTEIVKRAGDDPNADMLHQVRIKAKRCRYAAEALMPLARRRRAEAASFVRALADLQSVLGELHDAELEAERLRAVIVGDRFVAGELAALEGLRAEAARASWRKIWRKASRPRLRFWRRRRA